jgi:alpha-1,6-mannosyltransferase
MHLVDISMFYAVEGGGVSTYLNAKSRWLGLNSNLRHTIVSSSIGAGSAGGAVLAVPGLALPGLRGYRLPRSVGAAAAVLARLQPDLIEVGDASQFAWAALRARRRLQVPVVAFCHSDLARVAGQRLGSLARQASSHYLRQLYRRCDLVLAPSRSMLGQLQGLGIDGALCQPLGIDASVFCPQRRDAGLRRQLGLAPGIRLLVYAGRFAPEKNLGLLVAAVRRLGPPYHLLLVGSGHAPPPSAQVSIMPYQREPASLARLLASCDVLVHPGHCETFGLVVLEAMACGLPVVGVAGGAVAELVDGGTGVLVPPCDADALCQGIEAIYQGDRERLGRQARHKASTEFDWQRVMPQLVRHYAGLVRAAPVALAQAHGGCALD